MATDAPEIESSIPKSEFIEALGAATKTDIAFALGVCNSTIWAASDNRHGWIFASVWLVWAILNKAVEIAVRLR